MAPHAEAYARKVAPNIIERHTRNCPKSTIGPRLRCTCTPVYQARITADHQRHSQTFTSLAGAVHWASTARNSLRSHGQVSVPLLGDAAVDFVRRATLGEALTRARTRYAPSTINGYEQHLRNRVLPYADATTRRRLADTPVDEIQPRTIQRFVDHTTVNAGSSIARAANSALAAVLSDLYDQGLLDTLPARIKLPPPQPGRDLALTPTEAERLLETARSDDQHHARSLMLPLLSLLLASGCRITEALRLTWGADSCDLAADRAELRIARDTTKTNAGVRTITLDTDTTTLLREHRHRLGDPADGTPVIAHPAGGTIDRGGLVRTALHRIANNADLPRVTPHVLRHTHATWAASAGTPMRALAARLGHADPSFTMRRYTHAAQADLNAIPDRIADYRRTATQQTAATAIDATDVAATSPDVLTSPR